MADSQTEDQPLQFEQADEAKNSPSAEGLKVKVSPTMPSLASAELHVRN
jgi:hypothetical protein